MSLSQLHPVTSLRGSRRRPKTVPLRPGAVPIRTDSAVAPAEPVEQARPIRERRYWIEHCEGFRVDGLRGRIGVVEAVRRPKTGDPVLVIRAGVLGRRVVEISVSEIFEIVPRARRLWLRTPEASRWSIVVPEPIEAARAQAAA